MARSHVAWSNSTPSLSLSSSSFRQSSICRGIPIQVEGQSQNESFFLSQELTLERSYSLLIRPASSSCLHQSYRDLPKESVQDWNSPSGPPSAFRSDQQLEEPKGSLQFNPHFPTRDLALEASQPKVPIAPLNHGFPYNVQNVLGLVAGLNPVPQPSGPRKLLPPIELGNREDQKDSEGGATIFSDYASHKYPYLYDDVQRYELSPTQTTCEGLGIFSDSSERGFSCEDEMQAFGPQSSFGSSIGYPGATLASTIERYQIIAPRRRLSYGEHLQTPDSKSLHRTVGYRELRDIIGCSTTAHHYAPDFQRISSTDRPGQHLDECRVPPRSKPRLRIDTFETSKRGQTPKSKPDNMEASSSKPRLWTAPDHDDQVSDEYWSKQAQTKVHVGTAVSFTKVNSDKYVSIYLYLFLGSA